MPFLNLMFALQTPAGQGGFVPVKDLPPAERLAAAPFLVIAYAFVWIALMVYLWTIWRRLNKVETDMQALERRVAQRSGRR